MEMAARQSLLQPAEQKRPNILVVEDNLVNQKILLKILDKKGYQCRVAGNGREAVEALRKNTYDVVLMDLQMPEMDGIEATAAIRNPANNCLDPNIPIIAVTANTGEADRRKCLAAGMNDYLTKPVNLNSLLEKIEKCYLNAPCPPETD